MAKGILEKRFYKKVVCSSIALVILSAGAATTAFSYSWFSNNNNITKPVNGYTAGAYFARGTGTKDDPYVINKPIHLYNLAWLQDIGYFDSKECYFIIEKDLDMTDWVLPPIGTEEHPFTGHLSGNDTEHSKDQTHTAVISNLTISNDFSAYKRHPSSITSFENCNIMGFFGKFGDNNNNPSASDFYLDGLKVESKETSNLIGMVAGYVNGDLSGIGVSNSTIKLPESGLSSYGNYTSNLSDYASVGYCEDKYKSAALSNEVTLQSSEVIQTSGTDGDGGSEAGNGGSIDMNAMYNNLLSIWKGVSAIQIPTKETITYDKEGNIVTDEITETTSASTLSYSSLDYYLANASQAYDSTHTAASYSFSRRTDSNLYMILHGKETITDASVKNQITENRTLVGAGKYISDSSSTNYLTLNGTTIGNSTSTDNASLVIITDAGRIKIVNQNNDAYYLRNSFGVLSAVEDEDSASIWEYDNTYKSYKNGTGIIQYSSSEGWHLESTGSIKIADSGKTYWLCSSGTSLAINNGTSYESSAVEWQIANDHYYTTINGTNYYFGTDSFSTNSTITGLAQTESGAFTSFTSSTGRVRFSVTNNQTTYYFSYGQAGWFGRKGLILTINKNSSWEFTLNETSLSGFSSILVSDSTKEFEYQETTTKSVASTYETNDTYYPISGTNGIPDEKNTGYVISGCRNTNDTMGDIRVSEFSKSSSAGLSNSGVYNSNNSLTTVKTINDSGIQTVSSSDFDHYDETKEKFEKILAKDSSYISGLHFMDATISKDNLVTLDYARIGNEEWIDQGYELPEDSIDFHLRKKGYVNFFAGTYAVGLVGGANNDSFFSFHEIERDESGAKIENIREIEEIYKPAGTKVKAAQSYVYKYTDGTYSVPFLHGSKTGVRYDLNGNVLTDRTPTTSFPSGYDSNPVFKTSWIKQNSSISSSYYYYAFYFEIPCNEGEYALGSVEGGTGAYLDYLDIGANAQRSDVSTLRELKTVSTYVYYYPKGVSFSFIGDTSNIALPTINEKENASFSLNSSFGGEITISKTVSSDKATISYETSNSSNNGVITEYKYQNIDVNGNGTSIAKATGLLTGNTNEDTITKITYLVFSDTTSTTTYKKVIDKDGGVTSSTIVDGEESEGTDAWPTDLDWNMSLENKACVYVFSLGEEEVTLTLTSTYSEVYSETDGTHFYVLSGYKISAVSTIDLEVTLVELDDETLLVKLKTGTGDAEDDYTTLTLNVTQIITA